MGFFAYFKFVSLALIAIWGACCIYYFMFSSRGYADSGVFAVILIAALPVFGLTIFWLIKFIQGKELYELGLLAAIYILAIVAYVVGYD